MRSRTASRTFSGSGRPAPSRRSSPRRPTLRRPVSCSAVASSSTKNGTPCVRSCSAARSDCASSPSRRSVASAAVPSASSGSSTSSWSWRARRRWDVQAPPRMAARQLVAAVGADQQERQTRRVPGQGRKQLERGGVGPLQVVEEDAGRRRAGGLRQHRRDRGGQRLPGSLRPARVAAPRPAAHRVGRTRAGAPPASRTSPLVATASSTRRVLPTPASPATRRRPPRPAPAAAQAVTTSWSSLLARDQPGLRAHGCESRLPRRSDHLAATRVATKMSAAPSTPGRVVPKYSVRPSADSEARVSPNGVLIASPRFCGVVHGPATRCRVAR